ncbi:MAG: helix-turn-helix transcriptional regulator [Eubacteriales bacterium]|nr:helix-turn-helix transcriptional regulator [Eubacteriales bacterium]
MQIGSKNDTSGGQKPHMLCGHHNMQRFMEICLLVLLCRDNGHGYALAERLAEFGFEELNISTMYRTLRKMEGDGWVKSRWHQGAGPRRRVYGITDTGKAELEEWTKVLEQRKARIEKVLGAYKKTQEE